MANKKAPTAYGKVYSGAHGNASREHLHDTLAATPIDTVIELGNFPAGVAIDRLLIDHAALGAGVTLDVGVIYPQGEAVDAPALFGNHNVAAVGQKAWAKAPVYIEKPCCLVAIVKGAPATGKLDVVVDYRFRGNGFTAN